MNSSWIGGAADTGLHERTPYWLNGFVPLAYQLQDPTLVKTVSQDLLHGLLSTFCCVHLQVQQYIDYILNHQSADGWFGPADISGGNCYWSKYPLLLALRQVRCFFHTAYYILHLIIHHL